MLVTLSAIKADVGSIGGHTRPTERMLDEVKRRLADAISEKLLIDGMVTHTGDDIALTMAKGSKIDNFESTTKAARPWA